MFGIDYSFILKGVRRKRDVVIDGDVETAVPRLVPGNYCCQAHLLPHTLPRDVMSESKHDPLHRFTIDSNLLSSHLI